MSEKKGKLYVVSGPSGVGKGTICKALIEKYPEVQLSVSATTRAPRKGEVEGVSYFFKTKEAFMELVREGKMLEYAEVYGNYYGTPLDKILEVIEKGQDIILEIEMDGAAQVREKYPEAVFVFILPPSLDALLSRIVGRGTESEESIRRRTLAAVGEIDRMDDYDYFIINDIIEESVMCLKCIMDGRSADRRKLDAMCVHNNHEIDVQQLLDKITGGNHASTIH